MIEIFNIEDSYKWYSKELLKERFKVALEISNDDRLKNGSFEKRLPTKHIERLEYKFNIIPEIKDPGIRVFLKIVSGYMKFLMRKVFEGHDVKMGAKLGVIGVRGKKVIPRIDYKGEIKGIAPSWAKTKKLWDSDPIAKAKKQLVYCFNEHSDGIKYKIIWFKKEVIVKNRTFYTLQFNRVNRRELWRLINEGKEYLVIE